jgi:signal recognition particle subunit SRP72
VEEETGIIRVQLGYVMQRLGRDKEAATVYNQVLKNKPSDIGLVAVASNNLLCLNRDQNIFDSKKRLKAATVEGLELKLTSGQRGAIARNSALLAMFTAQVDLCKQLVAELEPRPGDAGLILAAALARAGRHGEAVEERLAGGRDPVTLLTAGQVLLNAGETKEAVALLASLPADWRFRVGPLSALVTLHRALDQRAEAAKLLKAAVDWNKARGSSQAGGMAVVWRRTAEFHLKSGEAAVAAESLEELQKLEPSLTTLAQLVTAYAKFDLGKALAASKLLPPFKPPGNLDVDR